MEPQDTEKQGEKKEGSPAACWTQPCIRSTCLSAPADCPLKKHSGQVKMDKVELRDLIGGRSLEAILMNAKLITKLV